MTDERPDYGRLAQLEDSFLEVASVYAAISLDLFTAITSTDGTPDEVAAAAGVPARGVRVVLDALCALGYLGKAAGRYRLTATAEHYLLPSSVGYYGHSLLQTTLSARVMPALTESVRTGRAAPEFAGRDDVGELWAADFAPSLLSWPQEAAAAQRLWAAAGVDLAGLRDTRVLDLGCGAAVTSLVLARAHSSNRVRAVDLYPEVLAVAAQIAAAMNVADQLEPLPGDLRTLDFGLADVQVAYSRAVLYFYDAAAMASVFERVYQALAPGGLFLINHRMPDPDRRELVEPLLLAVQLFLYHADAAVPTFPEYAQLLRAAGFVDIEQPQSDMVLAHKP